MMARATTIGATRLVVISETIALVLVDVGSLKSPSSIFPDITKTLSKSGKASTSLFSLGSIAWIFSRSICRISRPFNSDLRV